MSVSSCAQHIAETYGLAVKPRDISRAIYNREVRVDLAPLKEGRRQIDPSLVPEIVRALRRSGKVGEAA